MYYFSYGSNMNHKQMKGRCPSANFVCRGRLSGYKFVYDGNSTYRKGAVANIIKSDKDIVEGVMFEIDDNCLQSLDGYEGYPRSYDRQTVEIVDDNGDSYQAIVYLREPQKLRRPGEEYRKIVLEGADDCVLPRLY